MTSLRPNQSRFCYTTLQRPSEPLCCATEQQPVTPSTLSIMSSLPCVVNNTRGATSQALLLSNCYLQQQNASQQSSIQDKVSTLLATATQVEDSLRRQLAAETDARYNPYRPRLPEFIPSSVIELEMRTRNVGVPVPVMTIANCKGVQFVTK